MPDVGSASQEDAFFHAYRVVRRIMDCATSLAEQLEANPDAEYAFSAERAGANYAYQNLNWDHVFPHLAELQRALQAELVQALPSDTVGALEEAFFMPHNPSR